MSEVLFKQISNQCGVNDLVEVEKMYYKCDCNEVKTIFHLMGMEMPLQRHEKTMRTVFDDLRDICDEKDTIFQGLINKQKEQEKHIK